MLYLPIVTCLLVINKVWFDIGLEHVRGLKLLTVENGFIFNSNIPTLRHQYVLSQERLPCGGWPLVFII